MEGDMVKVIFTTSTGYANGDHIDEHEIPRIEYGELVDSGELDNYLNEIAADLLFSYCGLSWEVSWEIAE